jgi:hypothetical protein
MRSARWLPRERREEREERPYLEAPSPYDRPLEPPKAETSEPEENPRVIVIEI